MRSGKMSSKENKRFLFEDMPISSAILKLSIPIVISSLVTIIYNLADTFFAQNQ